ncbi:MAG: 3'(2'),5'-bisphosphate nucleotidase CysQ [Verrucomicrobiaceae bacterium]|nr:3'(2'),5'-bisphosphate nucleotidase CysQ [Verrucomicrobiaceae bacterium]
MTDRIEMEEINRIAREAGRAVLEVYGTEFSVDVKEDLSPLTEADRRSNAVIVGALERLFPEIPIISEETRTVDYEERKDWDCFWLVDPLDGTKEFIKRNGEFTVNIALVRGQKPVLGVVYQPVGDFLYYASEGRGAWKSTGGGSPVRLSGGEHYASKAAVTVVASRSHLTDDVRAFVADLEARGKTVEFLSAGSSLKLCLVAEGAADVYPRLGPTMEWDTGAAHAVALEAGRRVVEHGTDRPLLYNKENLLNPFFVVE